MKTINYILSRAFQIFLIFLLVFMWIRFYEKNLWTALGFTAIITFFLDAIFNKILTRKSLKSDLKKAEQIRAENFTNYFIFSEKKEAVNFYADFLACQFPIEKKSDFVIFTNDGENNILFPLYLVEKIRARDIVEIYKKIAKLKPQKVLICACEFDIGVKNFASSLPINFVLLDKYEAYSRLMKKYDFYPKSTFEIKDKKQNTFRTLLSVALNKKRAKGYIFSSLILIFSSFFVKISVYYLAISSLLLVLALISFSNTTFNKKLPENLL